MKKPVKLSSHQKMENRTKIIVAVCSVIGILAGTFGTLLIQPKVQSQMPQPYDARVEQFEGVYIFIRCMPRVDNYVSMATVETNSLMRAVESANGKKGILNILSSAGESLLKDAKFDERLKAIIHESKRLYPDVQGLIFISDLTQCKLIKFK